MKIILKSSLIAFCLSFTQISFAGSFIDSASVLSVDKVYKQVRVEEPYQECYIKETVQNNGDGSATNEIIGGIIGGGAVSMGVAMNASMNPKERLELQNFYDQKQKIKTELQYEGLSVEIKDRLEKTLVDIDKKIEDKTLEVEERWLSKMSRKNFEDYTEVLGKQADLKQQYLEVTNKDSGLTEQQKKEKIAELVKDYQANHSRIEEFRNPLDYHSKKRRWLLSSPSSFERDHSF